MRAAGEFWRNREKAGVRCREVPTSGDVGESKLRERVHLAAVLSENVCRTGEG